MSVLLRTSQSRTCWSWAPDASQRPSGLKATDWTCPVCPVRIARARAVATSQSRTVLSAPAEATSVPSGLKATWATPLGCPRRLREWPVVRFQIRMSPV